MIKNLTRAIISFFSNRRLTSFLKIVISLGLITWILIYKVNWGRLINAFSEVEIPLLLAAFCMHIIGFLISALRWQKLLKSQGVSVKLLLLINSYLVASFFNFFMPTRIGGDVIRVSDLRGASGSLMKSASIVLFERFMGISILFFFALAASLFRIPLAKEVPAIWFGLAMGILGILMFFLFMYSPILGRILPYIPSSKMRDKIAAKGKEFSRIVKQLLLKRDVLALGLGYSFILQVNVILHFWLVGKSLGFDIPLLDYFFLIPIQLVILMLPTINGIGVREASSIILFGFYSISPARAVAFGFLDLAMRLVIAIIGWFRFITRRSASDQIVITSSTSSSNE